MGDNNLELLETRNTELHKVMKLQFIINELRSLNMNDDQSAEIKRALKHISIGNYVKLGETDTEQEYLLDLQEFASGGSSANLNYSDRKALHNKLTDKLRSTLTPVVELGQKLREELPSVFDNKSPSELSKDQCEIIRLEDQQRSSLQQLAEVCSRKDELLKTVAELKIGPHFVHEIKFQQAQGRLLQTKAELLRSFFINDMVTRTENSAKAYKEMERHIDELLKNKEKDLGEGSR